MSDREQQENKVRERIMLEFFRKLTIPEKYEIIRKCEQLSQNPNHIKIIVAK